MSQQNKENGPFTIAYYQTYFDVDTSTVLKRVGHAMLPRDGFIADACQGQIDLYGPFWTLTTLILSLYTTSTFASSVSQYLLDPEGRISTNLPLLSTATSIIYVYGLVVPVLLWTATKWLGIADWGLPESVGLYGYAMSSFVPASLLCVVPNTILRWAMIAAAGASSGYLLFRNFYPILVTAENKTTRLLIILVMLMHAGMSLIIKALFYA